MNSIDCNKRLKRIIDNFVGKHLRSLGFRKKGNRYYNESEFLKKIIEIQKLTPITEKNVSFTLNLQVHLTDRIKDGFPFPFFAPVLSNRIAMIHGRGDFWGVLSDSDEKPDEKDIMIGKKFEFILLEEILPLLSQINDLKDVISVLDNNTYHWLQPSSGGQTKKWKAVTYYALGKFNKSVELINEAIQEARFPEFRESLEEFKAQILSSLPPAAACFMLSLISFI